MPKAQKGDLSDNVVKGVPPVSPLGEWVMIQ